VAFVKIDVQGSEPSVCEGMVELLSRCPRTAIALEYGEGELLAQDHDPLALLEFFRGRGYIVHVLAKDGRFVVASPGRIDIEERGRGYADLLMLPGRV